MMLREMSFSSLLGLIGLSVTWISGGHGWYQEVTDCVIWLLYQNQCHQNVCHY